MPMALSMPVASTSDGSDAVTSEDWKKFKNVFYLVEKGGRGRPPGAGGFPPGPPQDFPRDTPRDFPPDFPPDSGAGQFRPRPGLPPGGPMGGGMMNLRLPRGAEILHDGKMLRLARVAEFPGADDAPPFR